MENIVSDIKKRFAVLNGQERLELLRWLADQHNADLNQYIFANLKFGPRFNSIPKYAGTCRCGHSSYRHWFINNDLKDCKSCECSGFYEG
jgi:hypothetical protein